MILVDRIDLHLPSGWNELTTEQLEMVAMSVIGTAGGAGELNMNKVKASLFFLFAGLDVTSGCDTGIPVSERYYTVRRSGVKDKREFRLYLSQVCYWAEHGLGWLESPCSRLKFPYPTFACRRLFSVRRYSGPATLMQNFSYSQYRVAGEYMSLYVMESNKLSRLAAGTRARKMQEEAVCKARAYFLATLFNRRIRYVDRETNLKTKGFMYVAGQGERNWKDFTGFSDVQFQCVLFWWSATMNWLQKRFPKVFKADSPDKNSRTNPLDLYTRITSNMEKYLGIHEESLNREFYMNVLQHLQNMMDESDRMRELDKK